MLRYALSLSREHWGAKRQDAIRLRRDAASKLPLKIIPASQLGQRVRGHGSVLAWWPGSDRALKDEVSRFPSIPWSQVSPLVCPRRAT